VTQVVRCANALPESFAALNAVAKAEGYDFLDRLGARWRDGAYLGDGDACVLACFADDRVIAIGAQTVDEYDPHPDHRRIRHFYVHPDMRRGGVGRTLAGALIQQTFELAPRLHLRATHALSTAFWDAMGFARVDHPTRTHVLRRDVLV
jgi:GNAT superfamily N-acetyltransferase